MSYRDWISKKRKKESESRPRAKFDNDYWRIGEHLDFSPGSEKAWETWYLENTDEGAEAGKARLNTITISQEKDFPQYSTCTSDELLSYLTDRKLKTSIPKAFAHATFVKRLQNADKRLTFPRFYELPQTIKLQIYIHYFLAIAVHKLLTIPAQPPLTLVSRSVRRDTLLHFYAAFSFNIDIWHKSRESPSRIRALLNIQKKGATEQSGLVTEHARIPPDHLIWFEKMKPAYLSAIRFLQISVPTYKFRLNTAYIGGYVQIGMYEIEDMVRCNCCGLFWHSPEADFLLDSLYDFYEALSPRSRLDIRMLERIRQVVDNAIQLS